jgi:hypothetical protein
LAKPRAYERNGRAQARPLCFRRPASSGPGPKSPDNMTDQSSGL